MFEFKCSNHYFIRFVPLLVFSHFHLHEYRKSNFSAIRYAAVADDGVEAIGDCVDNRRISVSNSKWPRQYCVYVETQQNNRIEANVVYRKATESKSLLNT